jgi:ATP-binding cassette subfamily B protein
MSGMMPIMMLIMNGVMLLIIWVGAKEIDLGNIRVGDMMAFMQYAMQIIMSFLMLSMVSIMLPRAAVSADRVMEVIEKDSSIIDPVKAEKFSDELRGQVEFREVYFRYHGADEDVLRNISFTAMPGEVTAFIGSTGSGKSTLINLIPRFYDVTAGSVIVDGKDVRNVSLKDLRDKIGYVPQKGVLFSGTIRSNLEYGTSGLTEDELQKVARISRSEEFILEKEDTYDSGISQGGTNVSGGQKQRLSIGRALAKEPEIFIFDDSFSALDYRTERELRKALKSELSSSTLLIVAQRISTIMNADRIIVLDEGEIVGIGKHRELMDTCGVYREIAESQLSKEELA